MDGLVPLDDDVSAILQDALMVLSSKVSDCSWKDGIVLFNDALGTFYLRSYGIRDMVKDHSDIERENPLPPHGLLFPISSKGTMAFVTPVVEHWLEREIDQWVHHEGSI